MVNRGISRRASDLTFLVAQILVVGMCATAAAASPPPYPKDIVPPFVSVESVSQGAWSVRWWQWAASFLPDESPVADLTGRLCANGQEGPVWFLAGTYESRLVTRACTVPRGRYLFFPIINYVVAPRANGTLTCSEAMSSAREMTDDPSILVAEIDGVKLEHLRQYRQASPRCFDLALRAKNDMSINTTAANGYYLMLAPLPPGRHTLRFGGRLPALTQAVSYILTVE